MEATKTGLQRRDIQLTARYTPRSGDALLTGVQAIARLLVEQHELDKRAGKITANFVSGYQGSPLAGVDRLLESMPGVLQASRTTFVPALNEELAATAIWGSQTDLPVGQRTTDGVVGFWYGKGPGLDRAVDTLRHMNMYGVHPDGGVVLLVGDDPGSKSSTVPAVSERTIASMHIPVLYPRNAAEIITLGLHAVQMSRLSGCVVALKVTTDVAEGGSIVREDDCDISPVLPDLTWNGQPWAFEQRGVVLSLPHIHAAEADLLGPRTEAVYAYARANQLNRVEISAPDPAIGIVTTGTTYNATMQAFQDLGVNDEDLRRAGISILRLGMMWPIDPVVVTDFARGLEELIVIEEKSSFVEMHVRDALYDLERPPRVLGGRGRDGEPFIPVHGEITADRLVRPLHNALGSLLTNATVPPTRIPLPIISTARTPYFCSGCPHNRSTVLPEGSVGGGGIGCHTMVTVEARETTNVTGITQMGGEGAQWIGQAPFTDVPHVFQNVGDGTFFHSGQLALQACIAANVNITYKILYNDVVAMTGAQDAQGALPIPELTHKLAAEGVKHIIICSEDPSNHRPSSLAPGTLLWHRDRLDEAQRRLRETPGVSVLIYEQHCAADARRQRKRGTMPERRTRVLINEAVCEGCGDCGVKSNCLSVQPVDTEFGRKTRIDQTSCNTDYSCLQGDCPSFITVETDADSAQTQSFPNAPDLPKPRPVEPRDATNVFIAGIGGTGIVTVTQILATAAFIEGYDVHTLDQTGLSQKAGPVTGHLKFARGSRDGANRVSGGSAECVLAFDLLTATTPQNLAYLDADRSTVIASTSATPTGNMVYDKDIAYPQPDELIARIQPLSTELITFDALAAAQAIFGHTENANLLVVGAACQTGQLQLSSEAVEEAITLNGVAVDANIEAFRWGRAAVSYPDVFREITAHDDSRVDPPLHEFDLADIPESIRPLVAQRASRLVDFQDRRVADGYLRDVRRVVARERELGTGNALSEAVARYLFKLLAYKDEYEVARLLTKTDDTANALVDVPGAKNVTFKLHPPVLRYLGRKEKIGFGPRSRWLIGILPYGKRLRGTAWDPFGYARVRRVERELITHYRQQLPSLLEMLPEEMTRAVRIASYPDMVRGYEDIKIKNVRAYCDALEQDGIDTSAIRRLVDE